MYIGNGLIHVVPVKANNLHCINAQFWIKGKTNKSFLSLFKLCTVIHAFDYRELILPPVDTSRSNYKRIYAPVFTSLRKYATLRQLIVTFEQCYSFHLTIVPNIKVHTFDKNVLNINMQVSEYLHPIYYEVILEAGCEIIYLIQHIDPI